MSRRRRIPDGHPPFADLPVRMIAARRGRERLAVHVSGRLGPGDLPLVCLAGFERNMADHSDLVRLLRRRLGEDYPIVLVDLLGRGRSDDRADKTAYASPVDAADVAALCAALGIERAAWLGQGYGGQVIMALAAHQPGLIAGAVLIDAGPVTDTRGLVRLHHNLSSLSQVRGEAARKVMFRRILAASYPGVPEEQFEALSLRTHFTDRRGRLRSLFDPHLIRMLEGFEPGDVLAAQWPLYDALASVPLLMFRTQLSDQLRRETFAEMLRRRDDAIGLIITGQGNPALLEHNDATDPIADFLERLNGRPVAADVTLAAQ